MWSRAQRKLNDTDFIPENTAYPRRFIACNIFGYTLHILGGYSACKVLGLNILMSLTIWVMSVI